MFSSHSQDFTLSIGSWKLDGWVIRCLTSHHGVQVNNKWTYVVFQKIFEIPREIIMKLHATKQPAQGDSLLHP